MSILDKILLFYGFNPQNYTHPRQERNAKILSVFLLLTHCVSFFFVGINTIILDNYARMSNGTLAISLTLLLLYYKKSKNTRITSLGLGFLLFLDTSIVHFFCPIPLYANVAWMACIIFFISTLHNLKTSIYMTFLGTIMYISATVLKDLQFNFPSSNYTTAGIITLNILILSFSSIIAIIQTLLIKEEERKIQDLWEREKKYFEKLANTNSALISMVGHDISTPLLAAQLIINKLQDNSKEIEKLKQHLHSIHAITQNIRTFQAYKNGKLELHKEIVNLQQVIDKSIEVVTPLANKKDISFNFLYDQKDSYDIQGDYSILQLSVVQNLLTNAIKFSPKNSIISISLERHFDTIELKVVDKGIGIPPELQAKLFDFNSVTTRQGTNNEKGTGFGLPLVKMFVDEFQGSITVESSVKEPTGTTFALTFPIGNIHKESFKQQDLH